MGRRKGSVNKKNLPVQLEFEDSNKSFEEKTEVCMTLENTDELIKDNEELEQIQQELDLARVDLEKTRLEIEAKKQELKATPVIEAKPIPNPSITIKDNALSQKIADRKARDSVMVTGKFYNLRVKGQSVKLPYLKYGDEPVKWWPLDHGKVYTIPKGFADQINGGTEEDPCYYTPHVIKNEGAIINPDEPESGIHSVDTSDKKYAFVPIGFSEPAM
jgi:hypothetical protein